MGLANFIGLVGVAGLVDKFFEGFDLLAEEVPAGLLAAVGGLDGFFHALGEVFEVMAAALVVEETALVAIFKVLLR